MTEVARKLGQEKAELSCVVIPSSGQQLLLPNVCIAEIMPWRRIKVVEDSPNWCLGFTGWRGLSLPVIHYPGFNQEDKLQTTPRCLIVMNRARLHRAAEFYALAADAVPRMVQLVEEDLTTQTGKLGSADVMNVSFGTEAATIPDLEYVETQVAKLVGGTPLG